MLTFGGNGHVFYSSCFIISLQLFNGRFYNPLDKDDAMRICRLKDVDEKEIIREIKKGSLLIYPTDTLIGIGCHAVKVGSVRKIRKLKKTRKPLSVIAPSKEWIKRNLKVRHSSYLGKLPGKYTLIFEKKRKSFLQECSLKGLGVRIPDHEFTRIVKKSGVPFVTTSVNVSGKKPISKVAQIPKKFLKHVDFVIDDGARRGKASHVFDLTGEKPKRIR